MLKAIPILFFLFATVKSYGQAHQSPDVKPTYEKSPQEKSRDVRKISAVLAKSECLENGATLVTNLKAILTISTNGKVTDARFPGLEITAECKYALRKEFLTMTGFKAGKMKGENVISSYTYSIVCIKWEEGKRFSKFLLTIVSFSKNLLYCTRL